MRKALIAATAIVVAIAPTPLAVEFGGLLASGMILAAPAPVTHADPININDPKCGGLTGQAYANCAQGIQRNLDANIAACRMAGDRPGLTEQQCEDMIRAHNRIAPPAQAPSSPTQAPVTTPVQAPHSPPTTGAPRNAGVVAPPKGLNAPSQAVTAAKNAPPTRVNPANPPKPLTHGDFHQQIKDAVDAHPRNVDVVSVNNQALVRPRHWDYLDYDVYHRPKLYNPLTEAMTFRYFYGGAYREVSVEAGGGIVLDMATAGVFPFTAVSDSYVAAGSFTGGAWVPPDGWDGPPPPTYSPPAPPTVYHDVSAYVPADNQTVQVGQVTPVGHDETQPAGSQDTFLIDDSTLAWGQVTDPNNGGQLTVTKTQSLPGVGPTDDGGVLLALAAHPRPSHKWWPWALGGAGLVIAAGVLGWMVMRRNRMPS